jgi:hypothetical protein
MSNEEPRKFAPIALFVYNRPWHTRQTVEALQSNLLAPESELHIYSDGARTESAQKDVDAVREYIRTIEGFRSVTVHTRSTNLGLAGNIVQGVTELVNTQGRIIVVEDDLVTSPHFLSFMNEALDLYEHHTDVISIHGYIYPTTGDLPETFFIKGADCWGWATWKRGWDLFNADGNALLQQLKEAGKLHEFDFEGSYPYSSMLQDMIAGKNDSWAVRWYASAFLANKLTLYPGRSLVFNTGADGSGTHGDGTGVFDTRLDNQPVAVQSIEVVEHQAAKARMIEFFRYGRKTTIAAKLQKAIKRLVDR